MNTNRFAFAVALFSAIAICPLQAQMTSSSGAASGPQSSPQGSPGARTGRQQPCWQQAGIPSSTVQQYRGIMQSTRQEVESVCSDASLSQSQKQQKVQLLRTQARQQVEGLVTAQQLQALDSCRQQRGEKARGALGATPCAGSPRNNQASPNEQ
jgi:Spy/CpxP family protein refolding chaperone